MNRRLIGCLVVVVSLAGAVSAAAQDTVPGPRATVLMDKPLAFAGQTTSQWDLLYPASSGAPLTGTPFITHVRLTLTPTAGGAGIVTSIPRAQVSVETTTAQCTGGPPPCLRIADVPMPAGAFNLTVNFTDGQGRQGGPSTAVPFTGAHPLPGVPATLRVGPPS